MIGGRYSLDREIGRGGMGSVWLGRDEVLGRPVAIKRVGLLPGGSSPDLVRAEREARIAARVNHPHVVAIFDLVHESDQKWLVMEYVEGSTLAEHIATKGRLTDDEAAPLFSQAAEALSAAHAAGVVHRDVKPSNILVTPSGQVKLSDFGIARAEADASLTATGLVTGSPAYIAPEVASGRTATAASDVWSLGATAFHALAGRPPYAVGDNVLGALYRIVHEEPPRLADGGWLTPFVTAAMSREPGDRWSMGEVSGFLSSRGAVLPAAASPVRQAAPLAQSAPDGPTQVLPTPVRAHTVVPPVGPPGTASAEGRTRRSRALPAVAVVCAVVLAVLVGALMLADGEDPSPGADASDSASTKSPPRRSPAPDRGQLMEAFVTDYLATADDDPEAAFSLLTPAYQAQSNGLSGYEGFWGEVTNVQIESVSADVDTLEVTYTYTYNLRGEGKRSDTVVMQLEPDADGRFLVAGAQTVA